MSKAFGFIFLFLFLISSLFAQNNNDFYDDTATSILQGPQEIEIVGEISNAGKVTISKLPLRSVIVRETSWENDKLQFIGAYRYDGHSLFDILKEKFVNKINAKEFESVIDLMVVVENAAGERVVLSWGEIFYPQILHRIIIATAVSPIIPSKTKEQWPIPQETKLIVSGDLLTLRNISQPSKIRIISSPLSFKCNRNLQPLYSDRITVWDGEKKEIAKLDEIPSGYEKRTFPSVFFGRGKGYHGREDFCGVLLQDVLRKSIPFSPENLKLGYLTIAGIDGYRVVITFGELFNRNDYADFLLLDKGKDSDGGRFSIFPAPDFFSDRAIKAIREIHYRVMVAESAPNSSGNNK